MLQYPLNYIENMGIGTHEITISVQEFEALRLIAMATGAIGLPPQYGFSIVYDMKSNVATVKINRNEYEKWQNLPARMVMTLGLVRFMCQKASKGGAKFWISVDDDSDYARLRTYISRSLHEVTYRRDGNRVLITRDVHEGDGPKRVDVGIRRGLDSFMTEGSEAYIRQRVSYMNRELETDYRVRKISAGQFCVVRANARDKTGYDKLSRLFLAMPTQENADALIEAVRGMVQNNLF
jgi:hypothetical protein